MRGIAAAAAGAREKNASPRAGQNETNVIAIQSTSGDGADASWYGFIGPTATGTASSGGGYLGGGSGGAALPGSNAAPANALSPELAQRLRALEDATRASHGVFEAKLAKTNAELEAVRAAVTTIDGRFDELTALLKAQQGAAGPPRSNDNNDAKLDEILEMLRTVHRF